MADLAPGHRLAAPALGLADLGVPGHQLGPDAAGGVVGDALDHAQPPADPPHRLGVAAHPFGHPRLLQAQLGLGHHVRAEQGAGRGGRPRGAAVVAGPLADVAEALPGRGQLGGLDPLHRDAPTRQCPAVEQGRVDVGVHCRGPGVPPPRAYVPGVVVAAGHGRSGGRAVSASLSSPSRASARVPGPAVQLLAPPERQSFVGAVADDDRAEADEPGALDGEELLEREGIRTCLVQRREPRRSRPARREEVGEVPLGEGRPQHGGVAECLAVQGSGAGRSAPSPPSRRCRGARRWPRPPAGPATAPRGTSGCPWTARPAAGPHGGAAVHRPTPR